MAVSKLRRAKGLAPVPVVNPDPTPVKASITTEMLPQDILVEYIGRIHEAWRKSYEAIRDVGRILDEAKTKLGKRDWQRLIREGGLPFSEATASKLMAIARDTRLSHVKTLPASWGTLYELTTLDDVTFTAAAERCLIKPEMERKDVLALKAPAGTSGTPAVTSGTPAVTSGTPTTGTTTQASRDAPTTSTGRGTRAPLDPNIRNDAIMANFNAAIGAALGAIDTLLSVSRKSLSRAAVDPVEAAARYQGNLDDLEEAARWLQAMAVAAEAQRASQAKAA